MGLPVGKIHDTHGAIPAARDEPFPGRIEFHAVDGVGMVAQNLLRADDGSGPGADFPETQGLIKACRCEEFAIGMKSNGEDDVGVAGKSRPLPPVGHIIQSNFPLCGWLPSGHCQELAVRTELYIVHGTENIGQRLDGLELRQIPDGDVAIAAGRQ